MNRFLVKPIGRNDFLAAVAEEAKSRLGRGLAALMGDVGDEAQVLERTRSQRRVPVEFLQLE